MKTFDNIYATCVSVNGDGVLIFGKSGSGKSDLALRLIENKNAVLVSDDRTDLWVDSDKLFAKPPAKIEGLLEVRGLGIVRLQYLDHVEIKLVINLVPELNQIERMPEEKFYEINGINIPMLDLYPFEASVVDKVVIKLKASLES